MKEAYFAGGCFWCVTPIYKMYGVDKVICGYAGGDEENPTYEQVKHQETGHRETIKLVYDPEKVTYEKLLGIYFANVDPFDSEGQFIDKGFSYTLAIFYNDETEKELAEKKIKEIENSAGKETFVALLPFKNFYEAEDYHQDYYLKNPEAFEKELVESGRKKNMITYKKLTENELETFIDMRITQLTEEYTSEGREVPKDVDLKAALFDYYHRHMADGTFVSWLALDGDKIIGTSGMSFVEKPPYFTCPSGKLGLLSSMFTNPDYRRMGIAKELLSRVVEEARAYGCGSVHITASDMGVKLYTAFGFKHNGNFMMYNLS